MITTKEFRAWAIAQVEQDIKDNNYPCSISNVSNVYEGGCEWCDRTTLRIHISIDKLPGAGDFTKGHCNFGQYTIHEDPKFRSQSDWFVCGQCKDS